MPQGKVTLQDHPSSRATCNHRITVQPLPLPSPASLTPPLVTIPRARSVNLWQVNLCLKCYFQNLRQVANP